jgi:hypothetical protein
MEIKEPEVAESKSEKPINLFKKRKYQDKGGENKIEILGISDESDIPNKNFLYVFKMVEDSHIYTKTGEEIAKEFPSELMRNY